MSSTVTCVGHAVLDHRFWVPHFPPTRPRTDANRYVTALGGPAAVASVTASRLGSAARFVGVRGDDDPGRASLQHLRAERVNVTHYVAAPACSTTVCAVLIDATGERHIIRHRTGAFPAGSATFPVNAVAGSDAVLIHPLWQEGALRAARFAFELNIPVVLDLDRWYEVTDELLRYTTHVVADAELTRELGGWEGAARALDAAGVWWALTQGSEGVRHASGIVPALRVPVTDSTGAGDVFHGAFTHALARGESELAAMQVATAAAACRVRDGEVPTWERVANLLGSEATTREAGE